MVTIRKIMSSPVVAVRATDSVGDALTLLTEQHTGGLPVVDTQGAVVGMVSELALLDVVFDADVKQQCVSQYMTQNVHVVHPDDLLSRAAQLFALYSFRRLPVVEEGRLVGIVTRRDLMNHAVRTGEVLNEPLLELIPSLAPMS